MCAPHMSGPGPPLRASRRCVAVCCERVTAARAEHTAARAEAALGHPERAAELGARALRWLPPR